MPRKVLTAVVPDPHEDGAIQVEVMLPVRQTSRRAQSGRLDQVRLQTACRGFRGSRG